MLRLYRVNFLVGQRVLSWTRYYDNEAAAEADACAVVLDAYPNARNITIAALEA